MKDLRIIGLFFLLFGFFALVSCTDDNIDETEEEEMFAEPKEVLEVNPLIARSRSTDPTMEASEGLDLGCFSIAFPLALIDLEGNTYQVNDTESFEELFMDSTLIDVVIDFVYPLLIEDGEGETTTIEDALGLGEAFAKCIPEIGWDEEQFPAYLIGSDNSCFNLVYPINVTDIDGQESVIDTEEEFIEVLANDFVFFSYPIRLISEDGETIEIGDTEEFFNVLTSCNDVYSDSSYVDWGGAYDFDRIGCLTISLPFDVVLEDGSIESVIDEDQFRELMFSGEVVDFSYPITLTSDDGTVYVVDAEEDFYKVLAACDDEFGIISNLDLSFLILGSTPIIDDTGNEVLSACWQVVYPLQVNIVDEEGNTETKTLNSSVEVEDTLNENFDKVINLTYPVSVVTLADSTTVEFQSVDDLLEAFNNCQ